jgi:hypothetical protein
MSSPIRSASVSPFAAGRPQVHSRRVSLRVGAFGLTYSTDRVLWNAEPPPVDPAPPVESEPRAGQGTQSSSFPLDLEAARRRTLWASAQEQAARHGADGPGADGQQVGGQQAARHGADGPGADGQQVGGQQVGGQQADGKQIGGQVSGSLAESHAAPEAAQAGQAPGPETASAQSGNAQTGSAGARPGQSRAERALAQALRHATQAYLACQASFACPRPMLQAVA